MTEPDKFEARLVGYSKQLRKDGPWIEVKFHIHPSDVTEALQKAPLGQSFGVVAVPITEAASPTTGQPGGSERKIEDLPPVQWAFLACENERFQSWVMMEFLNQYKYAGLTVPGFVREYCGVKSRSELDTNPEAAEKWKSLYGKYKDSMLPERRG